MLPVGCAVPLFASFLPSWLQAFPGSELPVQGASAQERPVAVLPALPCGPHSLACWDVTPGLGRLCPLRLSRARGTPGRELPGTFGLGPRPSSSFPSGRPQLVVSVSGTTLGRRKGRGWGQRGLTCVRNFPAWASLRWAVVFLLSRVQTERAKRLLRHLWEGSEPAL